MYHLIYQMIYLWLQACSKVLNHKKKILITREITKAADFPTLAEMETLPAHVTAWPTEN